MAAYCVDDDTDQAALTRAYAYLIRCDARWLLNTPGLDNRRILQARQRQLAGEAMGLEALLACCRLLPHPALDERKVTA